MITAEKKTGANAMVEEVLRQNKISDAADILRSTSTSYIVLGSLEVLFGLIAAGSPLASSAFFAFLAGIAVLVGGVAETVSSIVKKSWGRFFLGAFGIIAGALLIAHPLFNLNFLTLLLAVYLIAGGSAMLADYRESGWRMTGGVLGVLLGFIVLFSLPAASLVLLGLYVGISLIVGGISTIVLGTRIRSSLNRALETGRSL